MHIDNDKLYRVALWLETAAMLFSRIYSIDPKDRKSEAEIRAMVLLGVHCGHVEITYFSLNGLERKFGKK